MHTIPFPISITHHFQTFTFSKVTNGKQVKTKQDNICLIFSAYSAAGNIFFIIWKGDEFAFIYPTVVRMNADRTVDLFKNTVPLGATSSGVVRVNNPDMYQRSGINVNAFVFTFACTDPAMNTVDFRAKIGTTVANTLTLHTHPKSQPFAHKTNGEELNYRSEMLFKDSGDTPYFGENPVHTLAITSETDAIDLVLDLFSDDDGNAVSAIEASMDREVVAAIYGANNIDAGVASLKLAQDFRDNLTGPSVFNPSNSD
jgi:hypothetical protein